MFCPFHTFWSVDDVVVVEHLRHVSSTFELQPVTLDVHHSCVIAVPSRWGWISSMRSRNSMRRSHQRVERGPSAAAISLSVFGSACTLPCALSLPASTTTGLGSFSSALLRFRGPRGARRLQQQPMPWPLAIFLMAGVTRLLQLQQVMSSLEVLPMTLASHHASVITEPSASGEFSARSFKQRSRPSGKAQRAAPEFLLQRQPMPWPFTTFLMEGFTQM